MTESDNIRTVKLFWLLLFAGSLGILDCPGNCQAQEGNRLQELVIGRETFFDFGPPFQYFDIYVVNRKNTGISLERASLTPEANKCYALAKVEFVEKSSPISIEELLSGKDPCQIPEKKLKKETKKQRRAMGFSGANMVFRVTCGSQIRTLRTGIGDKDWFDEKPDTPVNTSWTTQVLGKLDNIAGPTAMDKPVFDLNAAASDPPLVKNPVIAQKLAAGDYDDLFPGSTQKASAIYKASLVKAPEPTVSLTDSSPVKPTVFTLPPYPRLPLLAAHQGWARLHLMVAADGTVSTTTVYEGSKLFEGVVKDAVIGWKFPPDASEREVTVSLEFKLNCNPASD